MRYTCKTIIGMICLFFMPYHSYAQSTEDVVQEAIDVLKGKTLSKSTEWAVEILRTTEDEQHKPIAMNALGVAYLKGVGITQDSAKAVMFLEGAARLGYTSSYYNLGMMIKDAPRGKQYFPKAIYYFEKGAEQGNLSCIYAADYMYYKGLGCTQDYHRAADYFKSDVKGLSPSCQYMLGLCYRNGFGVEQNEQLAEVYLKKATMANYKFAIEETLRENAEVDASTILTDNDEYIPASMPEVEPFITDNSELTGDYKGVIVTYDWSGNQIIREEALDISFSKSDDGYNGVWIQGADTLAVKVSLAADGKLLFSDSRISIQDRYTEGKKIECVFDDASLALVGSSLTGGFSMYSLTHNEPMRPMYLSLNNTNVNEMDGEHYRCAMSAYPCNGQVEVRFMLPKDTNESVISITDQNGILTKHFRLGALKAGQQRYTISANLPNGLYVVNMKANEYHGHTTISLNK